jgi:GntR family transcriptional regulator
MNSIIDHGGLAAQLSLTATLGRISKTDPMPLYMQLQHTLRAAIQSGVLAADTAIPAERNLAEDLEISRITVRKAVDGLVEEGLLVKRRGAGTFVTRRFEKNFSTLSSFSEDMLARGRVPRSKWLSKAQGIVAPEEALSLGLSPGSEVCRFVRIRYADGTPMALEYTTLPAFCLPPLNQITSSLYAALELTGHRPVRALQRLRAVALTAEHAETLGVAPGAPGLFIERRGFLADGRTCELSHSYYPCDAYDVIAELNGAEGRRALED